MSVNLPLPLDDAPGPRESGVGRRVVRNGAATNDLVLSAHADGNENVFPKILDLYVRPGSVVGRRYLWQGRILAECTHEPILPHGYRHSGRRGLPQPAL